MNVISLFDWSYCALYCDWHKYSPNDIDFLYVNKLWKMKYVAFVVCLQVYDKHSVRLCRMSEKTFAVYFLKLAYFATSLHCVRK